MLNISRNLLSSWKDVEGVLNVVSGVTTLIMKFVEPMSSLHRPGLMDSDSRLGLQEIEQRTQSHVKELHLARSLITWSQVGTLF